MISYVSACSSLLRLPEVSVDSVWRTVFCSHPTTSRSTISSLIFSGSLLGVEWPLPQPPSPPHPQSPPQEHLSHPGRLPPKRILPRGYSFPLATTGGLTSRFPKESRPFRVVSWFPSHVAEIWTLVGEVESGWEWGGSPGRA